MLKPIFSLKFKLDKSLWYFCLASYAKIFPNVAREPKRVSPPLFNTINSRNEVNCSLIAFTKLKLIETCSILPA